MNIKIYDRLAKKIIETIDSELKIDDIGDSFVELSKKGKIIKIYETHAKALPELILEIEKKSSVNEKDLTDTVKIDYLFYPENAISVFEKIFKTLKKEDIEFDFNIVNANFEKEFGFSKINIHPENTSLILSLNDEFHLWVKNKKELNFVSELETYKNMEDYLHHKKRRSIVMNTKIRWIETFLENNTDDFDIKDEDSEKLFEFKVKDIVYIIKTDNENNKLKLFLKNTFGDLMPILHDVWGFHYAEFAKTIKNNTQYQKLSSEYIIRNELSMQIKNVIENQDWEFVDVDNVVSYNNSNYVLKIKKNDKELLVKWKRRYDDQIYPEEVEVESFEVIGSNKFEFKHILTKKYYKTDITYSIECDIDELNRKEIERFQNYLKLYDYEEEILNALK